MNEKIKPGLLCLLVSFVCLQSTEAQDYGKYQIDPQFRDSIQIKNEIYQALFPALCPPRYSLNEIEIVKIGNDKFIIMMTNLKNGNRIFSSIVTNDLHRESENTKYEAEVIVCQGFSIINSLESPELLILHLSSSRNNMQFLPKKIDDLAPTLVSLEHWSYTSSLERAKNKFDKIRDRKK